MESGRRRNRLGADFAPACCFAAEASFAFKTRRKPGCNTRFVVHVRASDVLQSYEAQLLLLIKWTGKRLSLTGDAAASELRERVIAVLDRWFRNASILRRPITVRAATTS